MSRVESSGASTGRLDRPGVQEVSFLSFLSTNPV